MATHSFGRTLPLLPVLLAIVAAARADPQPVPTDYSETIKVGLVQIEVTVWPEAGGDPALCRDLRADDFEMTVNGRLHPIVAVDWLGSREAMELAEGGPIEDPSRPPLSLVLFFDLWHLNVFFQSFQCPMTKPLAFDQARELVRREFRPGDRLLLVTFAGWPQVHAGWIRDPEEALEALDRLEVSPFVLNVRQSHLHHNEWIAGVKSLLLALGRYPGRKEIFYLGDDFRFDDVALQVYDLAARAQANQVTMHAVDLLGLCRSAPGPGCPGMSIGGLGCTDFAHPIALGYIAVNTGGGLFKGGETLAGAVRQVREMHGCRYLISFETTRSDKRAPRARVRLKRRGLRLNAPSSFGSPRREPTEREEQDALFLLPRFGAGLDAEVGLWPLRPTGEGKKWRGLLLARLKRAGEDPWPEGIERIEIEAVVHKESKVYGQFKKLLEGQELARFREASEARLFVFPLERIPPGLNSVALRAVGVGGDVSVNVRAMLEVPLPPGPGEAGPWFITDGLGHVGDTLTLLPALDGVLAAGHHALVVGYGCRGTSPEIGAGRLRSHGDAVVPVPIEWLERGPEAEDGCGWLAGRIDPALAPGLWRFEPPASLAAQARSASAHEGEAGTSRSSVPRASSLEFRIAAGPIAPGR